MKKKIAIIGNQWITKYLVDKLIKAGNKPSLIITNSAKNINDISGYYDLEFYTLKYKIDVIKVDNFDIKENILKKIKGEYDLALVYGWQKLVPKFLISFFNGNIFGIHGGPFKPPRCRGKAVFNWSIIMGFKKFYLYLFKINEYADSGDIVDIENFEIFDTDNIKTVYFKNCVISSNLILKNLKFLFDKKKKIYKAT